MIVQNKVDNDRPLSLHGSDGKKGEAMAPSKVWYMNARARRFLESTAIKGRQILERSGWLDRLQKGDIVAVKTHMGEAYMSGTSGP